MSGTGKKGGCFERIRRYGNINAPRAPCTIHVTHLGWNAIRAMFYGGPIPGPKMRHIVHLWNFLWDLFGEFGADSASFREMRDALFAEFEYKIRLTWKPVNSRFATRYDRPNQCRAH